MVLVQQTVAAANLEHIEKSEPKALPWKTAVHVPAPAALCHQLSFLSRDSPESSHLSKACCEPLTWLFQGGAFRHNSGSPTYLPAAATSLGRESGASGIEM